MVSVLETTLLRKHSHSSRLTPEGHTRSGIALRMNEGSEKRKHLAITM